MKIHFQTCHSWKLIEAILSRTFVDNDNLPFFHILFHVGNYNIPFVKSVSASNMTSVYKQSVKTAWEMIYCPSSLLFARRSCTYRFKLVVAKTNFTVYSMLSHISLVNTNIMYNENYLAFLARIYADSLVEKGCYHAKLLIM